MRKTKILLLIFTYNNITPMELPICPNCSFEFPYEEGTERVCSNCDHRRKEEKADSDTLIVIDSNGNQLAN